VRRIDQIEVATGEGRKGFFGAVEHVSGQKRSIIVHAFHDIVAAEGKEGQK